MKLIKATEADSERLKTFFSSVVLKGPMDVSIRREGKFFDHYKLSSEDSETLILVDDKNEINGMASLVFRRGIVNREKATWCLATDLRIAPTRAAITQWTKHFVPAIQEACDLRNCKYIFSAVEHSHNQAYNALIRPTSQSRRKLPRYFLVSRFNVISLHGRLPLALRPLTSIKLKVPTLEDVAPLCAYLRAQSELRPLSSLTEASEFLAQLGSWPGLSLSDFRIATDVAGNILGCAALWDGRKTQEILPEDYHGIAQTVHQGLVLASWLGMTRPTAARGQPMAMRMLTHIACDSGEVFHRLADDAFNRLGPREFLTYGYFRGHWRMLPPHSFISASIPYGLYLLLPQGSEPPPWLTPNPQGLPPQFEIAWL
jgi:hypothetical protein